MPTSIPAVIIRPMLPATVGAGAGAQYQRQYTQHGGEGGHKHRPQSQGGGLQHRIVTALPLRHQPVGEIDNQDARVC